ncbi:MAG: hypothetical protein NZ951_04165 [Dehalococcoidia bacterium]|nr:hypothetical protein [Dehalococcoidia bacterium]
MPSLQYLIDSMCANFTASAMYALVREAVADGPRTLGDLARRVAERDPSLDVGSARMLAEAAVQVLAERGEVHLQGEWVERAAAPSLAPHRG